LLLNYFEKSFGWISSKAWVCTGLIFACYFTTLFGQDIANYRYFKEITINASQVAGSSDLIDFPILISTKYGDANLRTTANGGSVNSPNGYDIIFTNEDGSTVLNHDIESFDQTTGSIYMWVKIPALSPSVDTKIRMYFGGPDINYASSAFNPDYKGVYHIDGSPDDFSSFNHHLALSGSPIIAANAPIH